MLTALPLALLSVAGCACSPSRALELVPSATNPVKVLIFPVAALWLAELPADAWAARVAGPFAGR